MMHPKIHDMFRTIEAQYNALYSKNIELCNRIREQDEHINFLNHEINRLQRLVSNLEAKLHSADSTPVRRIADRRLLKRGSSWLLEGSPLLNVSLLRCIRFYKPIVDSAFDGKLVGISTESRCYLYELSSRRYFILNDESKSIEPMANVNSRAPRRTHILLGSHVYTVHGCVLGVWDFGARSLVRSFNLSSEVSDACLWDNKVVLAMVDGRLLIYDQGNVQVVPLPEAKVTCVAAHGGGIFCGTGSGCLIGLFGQNVVTAAVRTTQATAIFAAAGQVFVSGMDGSVQRFRVVDERIEPADVVETREPIYVMNGLIHRQSCMLLMGSRSHVRYQAWGRPDDPMMCRCHKGNVFAVHVADGIIASVGSDFVINLWVVNDKKEGGDQ